jgi:hypothetical protein
MVRLFALFLLLFQAVQTVPAGDAKPEKYGFKEIPFGTPKEALIRVLCVRYGFKLVSSTRQIPFADLKEKDLIDTDSCCYGKYMLGDRPIETRWFFSQAGKFNQVQFRAGFSQTVPGRDSLKAAADFFCKMFEAKYGAPAKINDVQIALITQSEPTLFWEWSRPSVKISTAMNFDAGRYYAIASLVDAR